MNNASRNALKVHFVYKALTRPAMIGGVTFEYHGLNLIISVCSFIALGNILYGLIFIPLYIFGWLVCRHDPGFFEILFKKFKLPLMPNQSLWGVRCYEPY